MLERALYNYDASWYKMSARMQQVICIAIHQVQHAQIATIGPLDNLDYEMAFLVSGHSIHRVSCFL